ncbi:MAG TPA: HemK/PrmC family methyltransferase [Actinomycetota bacterium]|jgi:release factor glutamine methyltransferase|nr:HemK/PrmC family methyltransferase [Actinomycetota bacterium]
MVARRARGEPLAWVVGSTQFCGMRIAIEPGVFVPRPQSEALALRAVELLPADGVAVDLCTGCGAIAAVLRARRPEATILGTELDPAAVSCARRNGVDARAGDLDEPLPAELRSRVDVVTAVVPYVPTEELQLLPSDVRAFEPRVALDGGAGGLTVLGRAAEAAVVWLRRGGWAIFELGGDQAPRMREVFARLGFDDVRVYRDEDGLDRAIEARSPRRAEGQVEVATASVSASRAR